MVVLTEQMQPLVSAQVLPLNLRAALSAPGCPGALGGILALLHLGPPSNTAVRCACPGHQAVLQQLYCCSAFK